MSKELEANIFINNEKQLVDLLSYLAEQKMTVFEFLVEEPVVDSPKEAKKIIDNIVNDIKYPINLVINQMDQVFSVLRLNQRTDTKVGNFYAMQLSLMNIKDCNEPIRQFQMKLQDLTLEKKSSTSRMLKDLELLNDLVCGLIATVGDKEKRNALLPSTLTNYAPIFFKLQDNSATAKSEESTALLNKMIEEARKEIDDLYMTKLSKVMSEVDSITKTYLK